MLTLGGALIGPFWRPQSSSCFRCFHEYFTNKKDVLHPDRRSPLVRKRMFYPVTAALSHQAVWEATAFLTGNGQLRTEGRVLQLDWFGDLATRWIDLPQDCRCPRCK